MQVFVGSSCPSAHANFFYTSKQPFPESASVCHAHRFFPDIFTRFTNQGVCKTF